MSTRTFSVGCGFSLTVVGLLAASGFAQVEWRSAEAPAFAPVQGIADVLAKPLAGVVVRHVAVQLTRPVTAGEKAQLAAAGITLGAPLGGNAFFAAIDTSKVDPKSPAVLALLGGVQTIDPRWKMHPAFAAADDSAWTVVGTVAGAAGKPEPIVAVYVLLHADVAFDADAAAVFEKLGGRVQSALSTVNAVVVEIPRASAITLASEDIVQWIEPALPLLTPVNLENRALTHVNQVQAAPYNLSGAGVSVLVFDGGVARASHQDFGGRLTVIDGSGQITHATHVAGTVAGSGAASGGNNRGMAPAANILSAGVSTAQSGWLYTNPSDIEVDYAAAYDQGADLSNNSIGTNTETNGFPCTWQGDYGVTDAVIDSIVRGSQTVSDGQPFRIVWAAGNERQGSRCDVEGFGDYRSIAPPAGAKNHLCIGAVNANDDSMTNFSSWGPTDDGRMKPDFSAPGCQSNGDSGVTSCSDQSNTSYTVMCGTSMASPTVAGIAALMLQDWATHYPTEPLPRNSTLKVLLAQSAADRGNAGPDFQFGYGSVRADAAIDLLRSGAHAERVLVQGFSDIYTVSVPAESDPLVLTVAWDDPPATPNIIPSLINDLDLVVTAPGGQRHYPWTLNPANPASVAVRTTEDHLNNIEQVWVDTPAAGVWTIEVRGTGVPIGPQSYSIVSSSTTFSLSGSVSIEISPVALAPAFVDPGFPTSVTIHVGIEGDTLLADSVRLHYRVNGGAFASIVMDDVGGSVFQASLPAFSCGESPQYYFTAAGSQLGLVTLPEGGAPSAYSTLVGDQSQLHFDMETAEGWTRATSGDTATSGYWERTAPQATAAQPGEDVTPDPGTMCWVTGGLAGSGQNSFDVDSGTTTLLSPEFDLSNATDDTRIGYWRWYSNAVGGSPHMDTFTVGVSSNGGASWSNVEIVGPTGPETVGGWIYHEFRVANVIPLTSAVRLRFAASDLGGSSTVEAAIDGLTIFRVDCTNVCAAEFDQNGTVEVADIFAFLSAWFAQQPTADFDGVGGIGVPDIFAFLSAWFAGC